jgi:hypothetical protein
MSHAQPRQRPRALIAAAGATILAAGLAGAAIAPMQAVAATGTLAVTTPSNFKLAADTAKQVIILTVSGTNATKLSEDNVKDVTLHDTDTDCQNLDTYVVTSPTTVTIKTPTGGCSVSLTGPEDVVIEFTDTTTLTKTDGLTFVPPPAVKAASGTVQPVSTEYSADLTYAQIKKRFLSTGGQTVRVLADATYAFDPRSTAGLKVNLGGKDGTEVKVFTVAGAALPSTSTEAQVTAEVGNFLTFKTASGMDTATDTLVITQNGVSKSFTGAPVGSFDVVAGPVITAISPGFGKPNGGTTVTITATGLDKTLTAGTDTKVFFCGIEGTGAAFNTAGTALTVTTPNVTNSVNGLGTGNYAGTCPVTITLPNATPSPYTSPLNGASVFGFPNEA